MFGFEDTQIIGDGGTAVIDTPRRVYKRQTKTTLSLNDCSRSHRNDICLAADPRNEAQHGFHELISDMVRLRLRRSLYSMDPDFKKEKDIERIVNFAGETVIPRSSLVLVHLIGYESEKQIMEYLLGATYSNKKPFILVHPQKSSVGIPETPLLKAKVLYSTENEALTKLEMEIKRIN